MTEYTTRLNKIEDILEQYLPQKPSSNWQSDIFGTLPDSVTDIHFAPLITPCHDLLSLGGKRWRPLLLVLFSECAAQAISKQKTANFNTNVSDTSINSQETASCLKNAQNAAYALAPLIEFVHTASLIHDDIEDSAETRRGKPAAYISWGIDTAVNSGSWLYFAASDCIEKSGASDALKLSLFSLYTKELRRLHLGQAMDIAWHKDNTKLPSPAEYSAMVSLKTGTLASLAAQAGVLSGGGTLSDAQKAGIYASNAGIAFQILDDVINLTTGNPGKKRGDDIVEGKKSFPILIHLQNNPQDTNAIKECFEQAGHEGINSPAVEKCISIINKDGKNNAITKSKEKADTLIQNACSSIKSLFPDCKSAILIEKLFISMFSNTNESSGKNK